MRRARTAWLAAAIWIVWTAASVHAQSAAPTEVQVKAVFLFNFTKYVEWPPRAFRDASDPLTICVLDGDSYAPVVAQTVRGEIVRERSLAARTLRSADEIDGQGCSLVFVSGTASRDLPRLLSRLAGKPVLTVGESDDFAARGGMINLRKEQSRIHFEINQEAAERAGLKISSQLLKLGRIVVSQTE